MRRFDTKYIGTLLSVLRARLLYQSARFLFQEVLSFFFLFGSRTKVLYTRDGYIHLVLQRVCLLRNYGKEEVWEGIGRCYRLMNAKFRVKSERWDLHVFFVCGNSEWKRLVCR